jgi:hypothetical protein
MSKHGRKRPEKKGAHSFAVPETFKYHNEQEREKQQESNASYVC